MSQYFIDSSGTITSINNVTFNMITHNRYTLRSKHYWWIIKFIICFFRVAHDMDTNRVDAQGAQRDHNFL